MKAIIKNGEKSFFDLLEVKMPSYILVYDGWKEEHNEEIDVYRKNRPFTLYKYTGCYRKYIKYKSTHTFTTFPIDNSANWYDTLDLGREWTISSNFLVFDSMDEWKAWLSKDALTKLVFSSVNKKK